MNIILTESQLASIVQSTITERLGVPEHLLKSSTELFKTIVDAIKNNSKNFISAGYVRRYRYDIDGEYKIGDRVVKNVIFDLILYSIKNPDLTEPKITEFSHYSDRQTDMNYKTMSSHGDMEKIHLGVTIFAPKKWKIDMEHIGNLILMNERFNTSFAHELMHAYEEYKNPKETTYDRADYRSYIDTKFTIFPMSRLLQCLYFVHNIENSVRPAEIASEMGYNNVTRETFRDFVKENSVFVALDAIKSLTYDSFRGDLLDYLPEIASDLRRKSLWNIFNWFKRKSPTEQIDEFLIASYKELTKTKHEKLNQVLGTNFFDKMVAYAFLKNDKEKVINDYIKDSTRFDNNPLDFYKYEIKKISFIAEKMYKKVSKLYDLLPPSVEDGSGNIPLNKSK